MRSRCVVAPRQEGENIRKKLSEAGALRTGLRIARDEKYLFIPIIDGIEPGMETLELDFEEVEKRPHYTELLAMPDGLKDLLPASFDVVGDIYLVKLEDELLPHARQIGEAILKAHKNAKVVALDKGVKGELRTRDLEVIAGENRLATTHVEYGLKFQMDLGKVYFSPRLASERKRIADMVKPGETIIDMFAGVGPFSIMIAKRAKPDTIYAIDKNEFAIEYLNNNIKINKIKNIKVFLGDARQESEKLPKAHRVLMNLPHSSIDFLDAALKCAREQGVIHLYALAGEDDLENTKALIPDVAEQNNRKAKVTNVQLVHTYSPRDSVYCFDLFIK
jgi:tRNA (guanine37-N1)-methyltransferase